MTAFHLQGDELELYVLGALDGEAVRRVEWHVRGCSPCAEALAEEARAETTLRRLVPAVHVPAKVVSLPERAAQSRRSTSTPGALAAAAAILVAVWGLGAPRMPSGGGRSAVAEAAVLVCEASAEEPLCRWPVASLEAADNVCREPLACPVLQSRMR
jgi:anti-sigma factor RsiW